MLAVRLGASRAVDGSAAPLLDQMPALAHGRFCTRSLSIILLTIPIFFPVISVLDFGMSLEHVAIWFGILVLIVVEVGLITPPVGMNLFIINAMDRETPISETYRAVMYFIASDLVRVAILVLFPAITLFLLPS